MERNEHIRLASHVCAAPVRRDTNDRQFSVEFVRNGDLRHDIRKVRSAVCTGPVEFLFCPLSTERDGKVTEVKIGSIKCVEMAELPVARACVPVEICQVASVMATGSFSVRV